MIYAWRQQLLSPRPMASTLLLRRRSSLKIESSFFRIKIQRNLPKIFQAVNLMVRNTHNSTSDCLQTNGTCTLKELQDNMEYKCNYFPASYSKHFTVCWWYIILLQPEMHVTSSFHHFWLDRWNSGHSAHSCLLCHSIRSLLPQHHFDALPHASWCL